MNADLLIVLLLLGAAILMFAVNRPRVDAVALIAMVALPFTGVITVNEAIAGFANPNIVLIGAMFVIGEALARTGVARRIGDWLRPEGRLFVHIFCHRSFAYPFETEGDDNWMGRYFFTGGIMPSDDLLARFSDDLLVERQWRWNGRHYQRTADAWLLNLDQNRDRVLPILEEAYGPVESQRWFHRWRLFFLAVSELFGYRGGEEWFVGHYLLRPRSAVPASGQDPSFWRESASMN